MTGNGLKGGLIASQAIFMLIASFTAIAWYNVIEINVMIWSRFKRHKGLYFWSLCISSWGIALHALAFLAKFFQVWHNDTVSVAVIIVGWYGMVTGQSVVLYSRLHLVMRDNRRIKWVLYMIIADFFLFHVSTTVLIFGANSAHSEIFIDPFSVMEKIQVTAFASQETIISGLYIFYTWKIIRPGAAFQKPHYKKVMRQLLTVNIFIIIMDLSVLGTEFANRYEIQTTYKSAVYSIKLKLEFVILNQLVALTRSNNRSGNLGTRSTSRGPSAAERGEVPRMGGGNWDMRGPQGMTSSVQTYTVSASTSPQSTRIKAEQDDEIMRTIDVEVVVSEPESCSTRGSMYCMSCSSSEGPKKGPTVSVSRHCESMDSVSIGTTSHMPPIREV